MKASPMLWCHGIHPFLQTMMAQYPSCLLQLRHHTGLLRVTTAWHIQRWIKQEIKLIAHSTSKWKVQYFCLSPHRHSGSIRVSGEVPLPWVRSGIWGWVADLQKIFGLSVLRCPDLVAPNNGKLAGATCGNKYGSVCRYQCDVGFNIRSGSVVRKCEKQGKNSTDWTGSVTSCESMFHAIQLLIAQPIPL